MRRTWHKIALPWLLAASTTLLHSLSAQPTPTFTNVTVHDPAVIKAGARWYVYGSHGASAWTEDLMHWTQVATSVNSGAPAHFDTFQSELSELIAWTNATTLWAADVIQLGDGKFYYYYNVWTDLQSYRSYMGLAVANGIEGPYTDVAEIMRGGTGVAGFNPAIHPNTIDPDVFFDQHGQLWMVYGSYSGGIFILRLDHTTGSPTFGRPLPNQGWGTKLIGGNHAQIEGGCVIYSPESEYYYLFVSFGGLAANGGYNLRVFRSVNPDGPYVDAAGNNMATTTIANNLWPTLEPYGMKLMGNFQFQTAAGEPGAAQPGYVSPGHNSVYYDSTTDKYFLVFHTRFVGQGELHQVRVHQMFMNADEWFVVAPHRYAGEIITALDPAEISGNYKFINHGKAITATVSTSTLIALHADGTVTGAVTGTWQLSGDHDVTLDLGGTPYRGVVVRQWDDANQRWVLAFSALSGNGVAVWGSKLAIDAPLRITAHPVSLTQPAGGSATLSVSTTGGSSLAYQWFKNDNPVGGVTTSTLSFPALQADDAGDYTVQVTSGSDVVTSRSAQITVATPAPGRIINMSVRSAAGVNGEPLIVGFVVDGGGKPMLVRGIGPALADFNVTGVMPDPTLAMHARVNQQDTIVATNDNWGDDGLAATLAQAFAQVSAFALPDPASRDAALVTTVEGIRTVHINSAPPAQRGVVLVETYDLAPAPSPRLINVSARNYAGRDAETLIAGFVIDGNVPQRVLVRGIGPALAQFHVPSVLSDPRLEVHTRINGLDVTVAANDHWIDEPGVAAASATAFAFSLPVPSADAALVLTLPPGQYTALVMGAGTATGEALVEVYELP